MKKKTQLNEVRKLQKIAGLLKEDQSQVEDIVNTIVDWAGSGQGNVSGLKQGAPEIRQMLASISANPDLLDQVTKALQAHIDSSEGWTRDDIFILNRLGLDVVKAVSSEEAEREKILDIVQDNYGISDAVQEFLGWDEEDAENADGSNWDDVVDAIMNDPELKADFLED